MNQMKAGRTGIDLIRECFAKNGNGKGGNAHDENGRAKTGKEKIQRNVEAESTAAHWEICRVQTMSGLRRESNHAVFAM